MCDEWEQSFEAFYDWAMANGYNENLSIDRIDVDGDYSPANCRWATWEEQANNKRNNHLLTIDGETMSITQWAKKAGISSSIIHQRLKQGKQGQDLLIKLRPQQEAM